MKYKLVEKTLVCADIITPVMPIAQFSVTVIDSVPMTICNTLNNGDEMLSIFGKYKDDLTIDNVAKMIKEMETIHRRHEYQQYVINHGK